MGQSIDTKQTIGLIGKKAVRPETNGAHPATGRSLSLSRSPADTDDTYVRTPSPADFEEATLLSVYRTMLAARRLDHKMLTLFKQGKGSFHIGCSGHEATQTAVGLLSRPGKDWFCPYYRDLALVLTLGQTAEDTLLDHLSKASSPSSGGRQMPEHFANRDKRIFPVCSSVGSQWLPGLGLGLAIQQRGDDAYVLCSGGDGATSQGAFHEALNWATRSKVPILFLVQDNKYAISVPTTEQTAGGTPFKLTAGYEGLARYQVDGTDFFQVYGVAREAIKHVRSGKGPACLVADVVRLLPHSSSDNHLKYRTQEELDNSQKRDPIVQMEQALIEGNILAETDIEGIRKDIHDHINEAARWAEQQPDPPAENATRYVYFEDSLDLDFERPGTEAAGKPVVMVDAINHALHEEMERDDSILVYGEDVADPKGGVFSATRGLTDRFGSKRCFNSPLAEASIVGTAVGLGAAGYKPVIEIQFADYIWPAMQQLRNQVAPLRYRSNNMWSCPMVIRMPCGGYIHGGLCHSQNIESIFGHIPGYHVVMPSTAADAKGLLKRAIQGQDPVIFLEHKALYRAATARTSEPDEDYVLPFGKACLAHEGTDLTIITYGMMVHKCVRIAQQIAREDGSSIDVIDLRTIVPLDTDSILSSVKKTNRALVIHEDHEFIGFGAEICAQIADLAFEHLDAPIRRVAGAFTYVPFSPALERVVLPQDKQILQAVRSLLSY